MKYCKYLLLFCILPLAACCKNMPADKDKAYGVVINEIAAHDEIQDADTSVELLNASSERIDISGLGLYLSDEYFNDKCIWSAAEGTVLESGERLVLSTLDESLVTGIASDAQFVLKLSRSSKSSPVDVADRSGMFQSPSAASASGSYQRIPDGSSSWCNLTYSSLGVENTITDLSRTRPNAIWLRSLDRAAWLENDCKVMREMKSKGYDHLLLNAVAFVPSARKTTLEFMDAATRHGLVVHAWAQCFYDGGWICPVDDETHSLKQDLFDKIVDKCRGYIEDYGVKGIHLDYIRFPGSASKHAYPADGIYDYTAVTEFCRQIRNAVDEYEGNIVLSAALMPEKGTCAYYGQDKNRMGEYLDILMPMAYKYNYNASSRWLADISDYFADNGAGTPCWTGLQTYSGDDNVKALSTEEILSDCQTVASSDAEGVVLFRYPLGEFPDLCSLWQK